MLNIFITGASSYLGINVLKNIKNHNFFALSHRSPISEFENVKVVSIKDIEFSDYFNENKIDVIFHFATNSNRDISENNLIETKKTNLDLGKLIYSSAQDSNIKLFVNTGSYSQDIFETPPNFYVETKNLFGNYLKKNLNDQLAVLNLHLGDVYGAGDFRKKLIPYLLESENLEFVNLDSNGKGCFAPIYIKDILKILKKELNSTSKDYKYKKLILANSVCSVEEFIEQYKVIRRKSFDVRFNLQIKNPYENFIKLNDKELLSFTNLRQGLLSL